MELLTIDQVAELFKISKPSVYRWIDKGHISPVKIDGSVRFVRKDLEDFVERLKAGATQNSEEAA